MIFFQIHEMASLNQAPDGTVATSNTQNTNIPGDSVKPQLKTLRLKNNLAKIGIQLNKPNAKSKHNLKKNLSFLLHNKKSSNLAIRAMKNKFPAYRKYIRQNKTPRK